VGARQRIVWEEALPATAINPDARPLGTFEIDTHEGFCFWTMLQEHPPGAKLLRVYQPFHGYNSSSGAEFPPRKMLHDI